MFESKSQESNSINTVRPVMTLISHLQLPNSKPVGIAPTINSPKQSRYVVEHDFNHSTLKAESGGSL